MSGQIESTPAEKNELSRDAVDRLADSSKARCLNLQYRHDRLPLLWQLLEEYGWLAF